MTCSVGLAAFWASNKDWRDAAALLNRSAIVGNSITLS